MAKKKEDVKKEVQEEPKAADKVSVGSGDEVKKEEVASDFSELEELNSQIAADDAEFAKKEEASNKEKVEKLDSAIEEAGSEVVKEDKNDVEDSIDPALLQDIFGKKKEERESKQTKDQEIAELRRKVEKLAKKSEDLVEKPPPPPMSKEELIKAFEQDYPEIPGEQSVALVKFLDDHYQTRVLPAWKQTQEIEKQQSTYKEKVKTHKYYPFVKDEVDRLVKEDSQISQLPESQKWDRAMDRALASAVPELLKRQAKKTEKLTQEGKKLILRDAPANDVPKKGIKLDVSLTREDKSLQKQMNLSDKDLVTFKDNTTVIED